MYFFLFVISASDLHLVLDELEGLDAADALVLQSNDEPAARRTRIEPATLQRIPSGIPTGFTYRQGQRGWRMQTAAS